MFFVRLNISEGEDEIILARAVELGTAGSDQEGAAARFWFHAESEALRFAAMFPDAGTVCERQPDENWNAAWQGRWKPIIVGQRWYLTPPSYGSGETPEGRIRLNLRPGLSFGNGDHATTQLCLVLAEEAVQAGCVFADIGCGSGLLIEAATRLGARVSIGCDLDAGAVSEAAATGLAFRGSAEAIASDSTDVLNANIQLGVLIELLPELDRVLRPGGRAILSGILAAQAAELEAAVATQSRWQLVRSIEQDGWAALLFAANS